MVTSIFFFSFFASSLSDSPLFLDLDLDLELDLELDDLELSLLFDLDLLALSFFSMSLMGRAVTLGSSR